MLSIDLGMTNTAWCYIGQRDDPQCEADRWIVDFGMLNIDEGQHRGTTRQSITKYRCQKLVGFMRSMRDTYYIQTVIIEEQTPRNTICMNLMYALTAVAVEYGYDVFLFKPILKFTAIQQPFTTEHKAHKKLSIENCKTVLKTYFPDKNEWFKKYRKQDDIADAFNQAMVYGVLHDLLWIDLEEYKNLIMKSLSNG